MALCDVHAHLTHPRLAGDIPGIIARAQAAGVEKIVCNGLDPIDNEAVLALSRTYPMIRPALGFYPVDVVLADMRAMEIPYPDRRPAVDPDEAVKWLKENASQACAIGEIGLDGHWVPEALWPKQERYFCQLLELAKELGLPVILHTRKREQRTLEILQEIAPPIVDWHCFGGKFNLAAKAAQLGHYFSIPSNSRRSETFTKMIRSLPRDRIMLETDCPYLGAEKGQGSEPAHIAGTVAHAAELWQCSIELARETFSNNDASFFSGSHSQK